MRWLSLVGSFKLQVSFAEYPLFYRALLQKETYIFFRWGTPISLPCLLCGVSSMWRLSVISVQCFHSRTVPLSVCSVSPDSYACVKGDKTTKRGASWRGRAATRWSNTGTTSAHNAYAFALAPLLALRHCQGDTSSPFSAPFVVGPPVFANRAVRSLMFHLRTRTPISWWELYFQMNPKGIIFFG